MAWQEREPGYFATAEEAALCVARTPEGQVAVARAVPAESQGSLPALSSGALPKEEDTAPPMPPDAFVKDEVVVKEETDSNGPPKRQREKWLYRDVQV